METTGRIRILLADDHPMMRRGLVEEINAQSDMQVVAEASSGEEALSLYRQASPDVSLIDLRMPEIDGLETIRRIRAFDSNAKTIILTTSLADIQVFRAFQEGAYSYLLKNMLRAELLETLRTVAKGKKKVPGEVAAKLAEHALDQRLSAREVAVLQQASRGNSNKRIADVLRLSEHTIKTHFKNILQKLGAQDRTHAVAIAHKRGFFDVNEEL
ncbi:response regulator [Silvibacterium sp.]|uniref:response regulator n=1 Tax=Silvibacterium sp. TaxID=1964179 RepID=UPI0039E4E519